MTSIIHTESYPRAALIGNPSDGYFGKTIAFVFSNFQANIQLYETPELAILPQKNDRNTFKNKTEFYQTIERVGYYGGIRLLKASIKKFMDYCAHQKIQLDTRNFTIRYASNIPQRLGLAGSSAIITACMKALLQFYSLQMESPILANLILSVETEELGIAAGLQDRVAQVFETPVFMDFNKVQMQKEGYGKYEILDVQKFPNLYIAYRPHLSEGSEVVHNDLRKRYEEGEKKVTEAMKRFSAITTAFRQSLELGDKVQLGQLINENFDLRHSICAISKGNLELIERARSVGASAKFTGSGGAIIGTFEDNKMYQQLFTKLKAAGAEVLIPKVVCK